MSARHFNYEDDWENEILECPKCHWKGTFKEAGPRYFSEVMDCECPNCDYLQAPMLAIVNYSAGDGTDQRPRILQQKPSLQTPICNPSNPALRNLKPHDDVYRYRSAEEGEIVEVQVYYYPGGRNDWSCDVDPRGVWIGVFPKEINNGVARVKLFEGPKTSGLRFLVIEGREDEREKLEAIVERFDEVALEVTRIWKSENERAVQMIVDAIDEIRRGANECPTNAL